MMAVGDLVEFRRGFRGTWQTGYIEEMKPHAIVITQAEGKRRGERVTIQQGGKGRAGRVRELHGAACVAAVESIQLDAAFCPPSEALSALRVVRTAAALRPVPAPRARHRAPAFLAFVRTFCCCSCASQQGPTEAHHTGPRGVGQKADDYGAVPLCRACHACVTDCGTLPGLDQAETARRFAETTRELLTSWSARADRLASVPLLRLVAACLLVLVGLVGSAQGMPGHAAPAAQAERRIKARPVGGEGREGPALRHQEQRGWPSGPRNSSPMGSYFDACSKAWATRRTVVSSKGRPAIWRPSGRPATRRCRAPPPTSSRRRCCSSRNG